MGGVLLIYKIQQYSVQHEMELALNNRETLFQKLTLSLGDFQKSRINAHEIVFNGKMYDLRSINISGDKAELLVINDTREENIIENIKNSVNTNNQQNKGLPHLLANLFTLLYIPTVSNLSFLLKEKQQNNFPSFCEYIISHKSDTSSPPPKLG